MLDRNELQEEINTASKTSKVHKLSEEMVSTLLPSFIFEMFIIAKTDFSFMLNKMPYVTVYAFILRDKFNIKLAILFSSHFKVKSMR